MSRNIILAPGEYYHVYNRGVEKRNIFERKADYARFTAMLFLCNGTKPVHSNNQKRLRSDLKDFDDESRGERLVDIVSYCLMPNHFHLLLYEFRDTGISKFLQKLSTAYTMYFNKNRERNGALFQGKFKASHIDDDRYLKYLCAYIHLNPIKLIRPNWKEVGIGNTKSAEDYLDGYQYSSYLDYKDVARIENKIITLKNHPKYFDSLSELEKEMKEWLNFSHITEVEPR